MVTVQYIGLFNVPTQREFKSLEDAMYWISATGKTQDYRQGLVIIDSQN